MSQVIGLATPNLITLHKHGLETLETSMLFEITTMQVDGIIKIEDQVFCCLSGHLSKQHIIGSTDHDYHTDFALSHR